MFDPLYSEIAVEKSRELELALSQIALHKYYQGFDALMCYQMVHLYTVDLHMYGWKGGAFLCFIFKTVFYGCFKAFIGHFLKVSPKAVYLSQVQL